jgi:hypothetical protein
MYLAMYQDEHCRVYTHTHGTLMVAGDSVIFKGTQQIFFFKHNLNIIEGTQLGSI